MVSSGSGLAAHEGLQVSPDGAIQTRGFRGTEAQAGAHLDVEARGLNWDVMVVIKAGSSLTERAASGVTAAGATGQCRHCLARLQGLEFDCGPDGLQVLAEYWTNARRTKLDHPAITS